MVVQGAYFTNYREDVHVVGMMAPLIPGAIGCVVIRPDGSRYLARVMPGPARAGAAGLVPAVTYRHYGKREGTTIEWRIGRRPIVPEPCRCPRPF